MGSPLWRRYSEYILFVHSENKKETKTETKTNKISRLQEHKTIKDKVTRTPLKNRGQLK